MFRLASLLIFTGLMSGSVIAQSRATNDDAILYVYRVKSGFDTMLNPTIAFDGEEAARLEKGQIFGIRLKPGEHRLELLGRASREEPLIFTVEAGKRYYAHYRRGNSQVVALIHEADAMKDLKKLKPIELGAIKNPDLVFQPTELALGKK